MIQSSSNSPTRAQEVVEFIKGLILDSGLRPGDPLPPEAELCDQFGVGRTALREAVKILQSQRVLSVQQGRGTFVGALSLQAFVDQVTFHTLLEPDRSPQRLLDLLEIREILECGLLAKVIEQQRLPDRDEMEQILSVMKAEGNAGMVRAETDLLFHQALYQNLGNPLADELVRAFWGVHDGIWRIIPSIPHNVRHRKHVEAHHRILTAILDGDQAEAQHALLDHFGPLRRRITSLIPLMDQLP